MAVPRLRQAVRAVVLDPDDRIYLVLFELPHMDVWATLGGGIEKGESVHDALRRELHEEVGSVAFEIGPPIWTRTHLWSVSTDYDGQAETFFLVRVPSPELGTPLLSQERLRAELVVDGAWWTLDELQSASTEFAPTKLAELVTDLVASGPPGTPIDAGI